MQKLDYFNISFISLQNNSKWFIHFLITLGAKEVMFSANSTNNNSYFSRLHFASLSFL